MKKMTLSMFFVFFVISCLIPPAFAGGIEAPVFTPNGVRSVWVNPDRGGYNAYGRGYYGYDDEYYSRHWGNGGKWDVRDWAGIIHEARPVIIRVIETITRKNDDSLTRERVRRVYEYRRPRYSGGYPIQQPQYERRYERRH